ncbi:NUDIX hydrolase N-terminal domain-containing protein [Cupriavidus necator]|uniref:NUDIX hydrolase N-terminal domain-containing protein n=1 Tax=Cupriavidus necator TaxID=106590 RepID=UPI0014903D2C|nr:NUDIX hydrolase N-terminal domain-containing protein [Cupriavidus necator]
MAYAKDKYDTERYEEVQLIARQMLSRRYTLPIKRIAELSPDARAHPTPRVDVRGAVIENDQILLGH